jgi:hypothetical protein
MEPLHKKSIYNAAEIKKSSKCGCFFCISVQDSKDVVEFCDDGDTGLCPRCDIDSLLPGVTDLELLGDMHEKWFTEKSDIVL